MAREDKTGSDGSRQIALGAAAAVVVLCGFQFWWANRLQGALETQETRTAELEKAIGGLEETAIGLEKAALSLGQVNRQLERMEERLKPLEVVGDEWEFVVPDIQKVITELGELRAGIEVSLGVRLGQNATPQPPALDWTQPELFEAAKKAGAEVGIVLTDDEVRVPGRLAVREGILEYFAVLRGGKEHEALISLHGNTPDDQRHAPADFAVKLNNAIQALGFKPGRRCASRRAGPSLRRARPSTCSSSSRSRGRRCSPGPRTWSGTASRASRCSGASGCTSARGSPRTSPASSCSWRT